MNNLTVSVIIPTYQRAHLVGQAIESVLAQSYQDYEIIVVNDGSTDDTVARLAQFGTRIRVIHQSNRGLSAARNAGIRAACGNYLAFLDDDDRWLPHKLEQQMRLFAQKPALGLAYGDMRLFTDQGEYPQRYTEWCRPPLLQVAATLFRYNFIPLPTVMVRRACLEQVGLFDETLTACEDYDLWLRIIEHFPVGGLPEIVACYRVSADSIHRDEERMFVNELRVKEKAFARNPTLQRLPLTLLDPCFYERYLDLARWYLQAGKQAKAHATLVRYQQQRGTTPSVLSLLAACDKQLDKTPRTNPAAILPATILPIRNATAEQSVDDDKPLPFLDLAGDQVVLLAGSGRSGTTWVQSIINYRQDHRVIFEPFWPEKVAFLPRLPTEQLYLRPEDPAPYFLPHAMRILRGQFHTAWTDGRTPPGTYHRRLIKEIRAHLFLKWLVTQLPPLKVILLLRHPCAVSHSLAHVPWSSGAADLDKIIQQPHLLADFLAPFTSLIEATHDPFERNILLWAVKNYVTLKQFSLHPDDRRQTADTGPQQAQILLLFYEEIYTNPEAELTRLFTFLQLPLTAEAFAVWRQPSWTSTRRSAVVTGESVIDRWRVEVTPKQIERAVTLLQPFGLDQIYHEGSMPCYRP